jgi:hypothetical protein
VKLVRVARMAIVARVLSVAMATAVLALSAVTTDPKIIIEN